MNTSKKYGVEQICSLLGLSQRDSFAMRKKYNDLTTADVWAERLDEIGYKDKFLEITDS